MTTNFTMSTPLRARAAPSLQAGRGDVVDEMMLVLALVVLPLDFPMAQPVRPLVTLLLLAYGALRWRSLAPVLWQGRWFLALPLFCFLSMIWADRPMAAFRHGALLSLTMGFAALFAARLDPRQIAVAVLLSQGGLALASLIIDASGGVGGWSGVFAHKNVLGQRMLFLTLAGAAILLRPGYRGLWKLTALILLPLALFLVARSNSATAVILLAVMVPVAGLLALVWAPAASVRGLRPALVLGVLATGALALLILVNVYHIEPVNDLLDAFGKDRTLTKRTEIWALGNRAIAEAPWLGVGAANFWLVDNWTALQLTTRFQTMTQTFSFHNLYYQLIVDLGLIGLLVSLSVYGRAVYGIVATWWRDQRFADPFFITLTAVFVIRSLSEAELFYALVMGPILFWIMAFSALVRR
ncbi:O-antigen ligase family protein [Parvularcula sp. LCG005]|uniref:O-antigen ligase family protein n=1 Tax=Parvularcula sp. LCG005 TaxID=3078805 RepID=UPI0029429CF2|nr:O-antigen ligase family protein [Parvularcula sp. LCG005]WOI53880.1 O-antigen ligase family protein [Parvularcula sp. LCG005]